MYYTNLLLLLIILLSGCASAPITGTDDRGETSPIINSKGQEVTLYRQAITALYQNQLDEAEILFLKIIKMQPGLAGPWANLGLVYMKKGDTDNAIKNARIALDKNPKLAHAHNLLGYIETVKGNINQAITHYNHAISFKQDYALAHYNLALLYDTYLQDLPMAIKHYEHYLKLVEYKDKKTAEWLDELKRTLERKSS